MRMASRECGTRMVVYGREVSVDQELRSSAEIPKALVGGPVWEL